MKEINWIYGNTCEICGKSLGSSADSSNVCFECQEIDHSFTKGFSCATYEGPVKEILSGLKYRGQAFYAGKIAEAMNDRALGFMDDIHIDMILPVPMFKKKEKARGYNQSGLLASGIARFFDIPMHEDILFKVRETASMSSLDSGERRINLHNAFGIGYNKDKEITGKNILLVDDVYTTGSTADACAEVLNHNCITDVYVFTFASGVNMKRRLN